MRPHYEGNYLLLDPTCPAACPLTLAVAAAFDDAVVKSIYETTETTTASVNCGPDCHSTVVINAAGHGPVSFSDVEVSDSRDPS